MAAHGKTPRKKNHRTRAKKKLGSQRLTAEQKAKIAEAAKAGATNAEIAEYCDISNRMFQYWLSQDEDFKALVSGAKQFPINNARGALHRSATGYNYPVLIWERDKDGAEFVKRIETKHIPPNPLSLQFYLCNVDKDEKGNPNWKLPGKIVTLEQGESMKDGGLYLMPKPIVPQAAMA